MAQRNAIVRRLPAVETLGSVSRICSDKTGTLTLMEMMVVSAVTADSCLQGHWRGLCARRRGSEGWGTGRPEDSVLGLMGRVSMLCNDAEIRREERFGRSKATRPRERSIRSPQARHGTASRADRLSADRRYPVRVRAPLHGDIAPTAMPASSFSWSKGAPEVIFDHCDRQAVAGGPPAPIDRDRFSTASDELAAQGERVLALAWLEDPGVAARNLAPADLPKNLVLLGLIGLLDPPRKEAIEAVTECHAGGIRVTMITGDHKITAAAIAKMLGIGDGRTAVTGAEIEEMDTATIAGAGPGRRRLRTREPRAQTPPRQGYPGEQADRGDDRRRGERCPIAQKSRCRHRDGNQGHRGHQGGRRNGAGRRQLRLDHGRDKGRSNSLQ